MKTATRETVPRRPPRPKKKAMAMPLPVPEAAPVAPVEIVVSAAPSAPPSPFDEAAFLIEKLGLPEAPTMPVGKADPMPEGQTDVGRSRAGCAPSDPLCTGEADFAPGMAIQAQWVDEKWYGAKVLDSDPQRVKVAWDDGTDPMWLTRDKVRSVATAPIGTIPDVGDHIEGQWTNGEWYPARVLHVDMEKGIEVAWDDGSPNLWLARWQVRRPVAPLPPPPPPAKVAPKAPAEEPAPKPAPAPAPKVTKPAPKPISSPKADATAAMTPKVPGSTRNKILTGGAVVAFMGAAALLVKAVMTPEVKRK